MTTKLDQQISALGKSVVRIIKWLVDAVPTYCAACGRQLENKPAYKAELKGDIIRYLCLICGAKITGNTTNYVYEDDDDEFWPTPKRKRKPPFTNN